MHIKLGTRQSKWAQAAAESFANLIKNHSPEISVEIVSLDTPGDLHTKNVNGLGGLKSYVDALSVDVATNKIDAAVHTIKDVSWPDKFDNFPEATFTDNGIVTHGKLIIPAVTRGDTRDALVFRIGEDINSLQEKSSINVGTNSMVRAAFFKKMFPDSKFVIKTIRGNIDKRIAILDKGEYDILILSMDGLRAVNQEERANTIFSIDEMPPATGQALGAVEICADNNELVKLMNAISDNNSMECLRAEWALLKGLKATCTTPISGICQQDDEKGVRVLTAVMVDVDGNTIEASATQDVQEAPELIGLHIAQKLLTNGAERVTNSWCGKEEGLSQDPC